MKSGLIAMAIVALSSTVQAAEFKADVAAFRDGSVQDAQFSDVFGCTGGNISPSISWSGAPEGTKSFVVTLYDKDAPTGSGFWHWIVVDIPATATSLDASSGPAGSKLPDGAYMTNNDAGQAAFLGACPPPGETHEYKITVKALKVAKLEIPANASAAMVGFVSNMNKLAEATVVAEGRRR